MSRSSAQRRTDTSVERVAHRKGAPLSGAGEVPWRRAAGSPWVLLLAAPIVGTVYFLVLYLVAEASCSEDVGLLHPPVLRAVIIGTGVLSLAALGGYAWRAARGLRADTDGEDSDATAGENRRFMLTVGLLMLAMFAVFIVFLVTPLFGGSLC